MRRASIPGRSSAPEGQGAGEPDAPASAALALDLHPGNGQGPDPAELREALVGESTATEAPTLGVPDLTPETLPEEPVVAEESATAAPDPDGWLMPLLSLLIALGCAVFIFVQLRPDLLFKDTTPTGGDMGAHVLGPAYLRDHLLTQGRLTGWTPDWYAGFPLYHFYMVVPSLVILAINAGLPMPIGIGVAAGVGIVAALAATKLRRWRAPIIVGALLVAMLVVPAPYGIAFKLVTVSGLVFFPLAAWSLGRMAGAREPVPGFLALGSTVFLFDTNFSIYGGNIASTLAGEFAFSISLCLALVALGLTIRGMDHHADAATLGLTRSSRALAALVIALVALSHLIPLFFMLLALALAMLIDDRMPRSWALAIGVTFAVLPLSLADGVSALTVAATIGSVVVVAGAIIAADERVRTRFRWLLVTGPVAALLASFWLVPFYLQSAYFNDMGWERKNEITPLLLTTPMKIALPVAAIGAILALATRDRLGIMFAIMTAVFATAVANLGEGKLWNARLTPFYYLSVYLLAAIAIAHIVRLAAVAVSERFDAPHRGTLLGSMAVAVAATLIGVAIPLRAMPGGTLNQQTGVYSWLGLRSHARSFIPSWTAWNYTGYEEKKAYREYEGVVSTMTEVGDTNGCGRAMWEYVSTLDRYGTPMALMLLPFWTDGCIGSMEGLYFESSATTPFHFLNQSTLSEKPSRAQRELPYRNFDINTGVAQLQVMGVRYYMAQTDTAIAAAREQPELTEIAESQPWIIFEVANAELVEGLDTEPVVASGPTNLGDQAGKWEEGWISQAVTFYNNPQGYDAVPAEFGPDDWSRVTVQNATDGEPIADPAQVSNLDIDRDRISFSVDQVGKPVLVKTSFFPNWKVSGADGPYRAGPNLMVVVPTDTDVELHYGYTWKDIVGYFLTLVGIAGLVWLVRMDHGKPGWPRRRRKPTTDAANESVTEADEPMTDETVLPAEVDA